MKGLTVYVESCFLMYLKSFVHLSYLVSVWFVVKTV